MSTLVKVHAAGSRSRSHTRRRSGWKTALGILLTAVMLFPVYWMLEGYRAVLHQQLP
jgi:hypothetical protein